MPIIRIMTEKKSPQPVKVVFDPEPVRQKTGLNKFQFSHLIGISANGYSSLSNEPTQVRLETLAKIISKTGCKVEDLYRVEPLS